MKEFSEQEIIEFLDEVTRQYYPQGDNYYCSKDKNDFWHCGYTNDYPLQHGKGENFKIHNGLVLALMTLTLKTN